MTGLGWPSRSLLVATGSLNDADPTDPECPHRQRSTYCHLMHRADDSGFSCWYPHSAYISADMPLAQKKAIAAVRLAAAPIECNTKHGIAYTKCKCRRCGTGVDNEHHLLLNVVMWH
jgi:hypothetical protein